MVLVSNRQTRISVDCHSHPNLLLLKKFTSTTTGGQAPMSLLGYATVSMRLLSVINNQPAPLWRFHDFWRNDMSVQTYLLTYI